MHMCLKNNVELVQKVVDTKIISKFICSPVKLIANEFPSQKTFFFSTKLTKNIHTHIKRIFTVL